MPFFARYGDTILALQKSALKTRMATGDRHLPTMDILLTPVMIAVLLFQSYSWAARKSGGTAFPMKYSSVEYSYIDVADG